jgi:hypothetical protein
MTSDRLACCGEPMAIVRTPDLWEWSADFPRMWRCYDCGHFEPYDIGPEVSPR